MYFPKLKKSSNHDFILKTFFHSKYDKLIRHNTVVYFEFTLVSDELDDLSSQWLWLSTILIIYSLNSG